MAASVSDGTCPTREDVEDADNAHGGEKCNGNAAARILRLFTQRSSGLEANEEKNTPEQPDAQSRKAAERIRGIEWR